MSPTKKGADLPPNKPKPAANVDDRDAMTFQDVAEYLGCSYATVLLLVMRDGLLASRLGGGGDGWRVRRSDLEKWIAERPLEPYGIQKPKRPRSQMKPPKEK